MVEKEGVDMIVLPWPHRSLSPNARVHWAEKAKHSKQARKDGFYIARAAGYNGQTFAGYDGKLHLWINFFAKTRNFPDADNCLSSCKNFCDGIADALELNDKRFVYHPFVKDVVGGRVEIKITKDGSD